MYSNAIIMNRDRLISMIKDHQMEKSPRKMKTNLCIPRLRSGNNGNNKNKNNNLTPAMTLLERFREAVFRLIMLSALSKANSSSGAVADDRDQYYRGRHVSRSFYSPTDPHHSEAVADCIEFIKKKAVTDDDDDDESENESSIDVSPVPCEGILIQNYV